MSKRSRQSAAVSTPSGAPEEILSQVPVALEHGVKTFLKSTTANLVFDAARKFADIDQAAQGFSEGALKPAGGASKDTKAGKRVTDHVRRFFLAGRAPRQIQGQGQGQNEEKHIPERTWKAIFGRLWDLCDDTEKLVLFRLLDRNKLLDLDTMYKLTKGEIVGVAARQVEAKPTVQ